MTPFLPLLLVLASCLTAAETVRDANGDERILLLAGPVDLGTETRSVAYERAGKRQPATLWLVLGYVQRRDGAKADPIATIRNTIALYNAEDTLVVEREGDIPGFARTQLEPDLRNIDIGLHRQEIVNPNNHEKSTRVTVYTYTGLNGILRRLVFTISPAGGIQCDLEGTLAEGVGAPARRM